MLQGCRPDHLLTIRRAIVRPTAKRRQRTEEREEWQGLQQPLRPQQRLITLAAACFWGYCPFDLARTDGGARAFSKPVWVVLLVFTNVLGALLWSL
jgi:hypothetical protein